jgi:hypothetical protein
VPRSYLGARLSLAYTAQPHATETLWWGWKWDAWLLFAVEYWTTMTTGISPVCGRHAHLPSSTTFPIHNLLDTKESQAHQHRQPSTRCRVGTLPLDRDHLIAARYHGPRRRLAKGKGRWLRYWFRVVRYLTVCTNARIGAAARELLIAVWSVG